MRSDARPRSTATRRRSGELLLQVNIAYAGDIPGKTWKPGSKSLRHHSQPSKSSLTWGLDLSPRRYADPWLN
jgi:hypothetical protein